METPFETSERIPIRSLTDGIVESREQGLVILSPAAGKPHRRVVYVNSYGGLSIWERIKNGMLPSHHLWGCLELARMGYEVALAEPLAHFDIRRGPLPHDLKLFSFVRSWLAPDDLLYCGHTLLYWLPLLRRLGAINCRLVSLTYAREDLDFATAHDGIIALTPAAADEAHKLAPRAKVARLGWGADLGFFPTLPYNPNWLLSCGKTHRDHHTLCRAAGQSDVPLRVICPQLPPELRWPPNVTVVTGGECDDTVSYPELLHDYYGNCSGSLVILKDDPNEDTAVGFTSLIEAMAMARPVIVTRTGALPGQIDVEQEGCGFHVPPNDAGALAHAMNRLARNPVAAKEMGAQGRALCEKYYNIQRYASQLHKFFESLN